MKVKLFFFFFIFIISIGNAQEFKTYFNDSIKVDENNIPINENQSYAPKYFEKQKFGWTLYILKEPLLFNKPLNKEVYRLTWIRSFHNPIIVTFSKKEQNYLIQWKELKRGEIKSRIKDTSDISIDIILEAVAQSTQDGTKEVSETNWNQWVQMLNEVDYWSMNPDAGLPGLDGSTVYLEYSSNKGYRVVERWSPNEKSTFYRLYNFMLDLTDIEVPERERY